MNLEKTKLIRDALKFYSIHCEDMSTKEWNLARELEEQYSKKIQKKLISWYLVIRWSWSWYLGQSNCDTSRRYSKAIKMNKKRAEKYLGSYRQEFSDNTHIIREISFMNDKPIVRDSLGGYEWWLREKGLPF